MAVRSEARQHLANAGSARYDRVIGSVPPFVPSGNSLRRWQLRTARHAGVCRQTPTRHRIKDLAL